VNLTVALQKEKNKNKTKQMCQALCQSNLPCRLLILNTQLKTATTSGELCTNPILLLITYKYKLAIFSKKWL
jgi:hypothetical protein